MRGGRSFVPSSCPRRGAPVWGSSRARGLPAAAPPSAGRQRGPASVPRERGAASDTPSPRPNSPRSPCGEAPGTAWAPAAAAGPHSARPGAARSSARSRPLVPRRQQPPANQKARWVASHPHFALPPNRRSVGETVRSTNQSTPRGTNRQRARRGFKKAGGLINGQRERAERAGAVRLPWQRGAPPGGTVAADVAFKLNRHNRPACPVLLRAPLRPRPFPAGCPGACATHGHRGSVRAGTLARL